MGCWHGCGPYHVVYRHGRWAEPYWDAFDDEDELPVIPRRRRRRGGRDREAIAQSLEARLEDLREELERVQAALAELKTEAPGGSAE
jgi:hypothetical protein